MSEKKLLEKIKTLEAKLKKAGGFDLFLMAQLKSAYEEQYRWEEAESQRICDQERAEEEADGE